MKITFGRKFLGCVIATVLLFIIFVWTILLVPQAITAGVVIAYGGFVLTIWFAYVGGNVWSKWVKSKYFRGELNECNS